MVATHDLCKSFAPTSRQLLFAMYSFLGYGQFLLIVIIAVFTDTPLSLAQQGEFERLVDSWKVIDEEIQTLDLEGLKFYGTFRFSKRPLTREALLGQFVRRIQSLFSSTDGEVSIASLQVISEELFARNFQENLPIEPGAGKFGDRAIGSWRKFSLIEHADKHRADAEFLGNLTVVVRSESEEIRYEEAARQASFFPSWNTQMRVERISDFFFRPEIRNTSDQWALSQQEASATEFRSYSNSFIVNNTNNYITYYADIGPNGRPLMEMYQSEPLQIADGISMPRLIFKVFYLPQDQSVNSVLAYVVNRVRANQEIDPSRFVVSVPEMTTIVDFGSLDEDRTKRDGKPRYQVELVSAPVQNVEAFVRRPGFGLRQAAISAYRPEAEAPSLWSTFLIIVNVLVVILLGYLLYRRMQSFR